MRTTRPVLFIACLLMSFACTGGSDAVTSESRAEETELPTPSRELRRASLELRASLSLGVVDEAWTLVLDDFFELESEWLDARQREHFDVVQALVGSDRAEAAREGRIARVLFTDLTQWRSMVLRNPEMETETLPGGMPDTLARLFEHSRIRSRTAMAGLDTDLRNLELRLRDPEVTANDGQLSLIETEMIPLRERMIAIHRIRLEILPWFVQYARGEQFLALMDDPAIRGWLLAYDDGDSGSP